MPRKGRSHEEIVHALHHFEGGEKVPEVCRPLGVSEQTFYRWRSSLSDSACPSYASCAPSATKTAN